MRRACQPALCLDLTLISWPESAARLHPRLPYCALWEEATRDGAAHSLGVGTYPPFYVGQSSYKTYLEFLCKEMVSSSPFIKLFDHFFTSVWTHGFLFCTLGFNPTLLYSFVVHLLSVHLWPWELFSDRWLLCFCNTPPPMIVSF